MGTPVLHEDDGCSRSKRPVFRINIRNTNESGGRGNPDGRKFTCQKPEYTITGIAG